MRSLVLWAMPLALTVLPAITVADENPDANKPIVLEPTVLTEVLPVQHPGKGERTLLLPFTNQYDTPIKIDSYTVSCNCSRKLSYPKRLIQPNEKVLFELNYAVPQAVVDPLQMQFKIKGHRDQLDQPHQLELAVYQFELPVLEPVGLMTRHEKLHVISGNITRLGIVNSSGSEFSRASGVVEALPDMSVNCSFSDHFIGKHRYQKIVAEIKGLEKYFDIDVKERPKELKLKFFAAIGEQLTESSVASIAIPIEWLSAIEYFPKHIQAPLDIELVEINLVGRSASIMDLEDEIEVTVNAEKISKPAFSIMKVSSKWLRVVIPRDVAIPNKSAGKIMITIPDRGWRFEIPISVRSSNERVEK